MKGNARSSSRRYKTMALTGKSWIALLSIAVAGAGEKDQAPFKPGPVESYELRQTIQKVTVAAQPFRSDAQTATAFGKLNPNRFGVLPVLVLIRNDSAKALSLANMSVEFVTPDRDHVEATPASDLKYLSGSARPRPVTGPPIPGLPPRVSRKKGPLDKWEIEGRAFSAQMLPPGETASGFVYFRAVYRSGCTLFVRGLREAATGQELFYFEVPLDKP
jgi:hypothetical protein